MRIDGDDEFGILFRILPLGMLPLFAAAIWLRPTLPPLPNSLAFGCYSTNRGPDVRLDGHGMQILQPGFPLIRYHLERSKQGIVLLAEASIDADSAPSGYRFTIRQNGGGLYLPFYRIQNGRWYGVFDPADIARFRMVARSGNVIVFEPAPVERCDTP